jgi:hypothetical protein
MIAAGALAVCFNLAVWRMHPDWPIETLLRWMCGALVLWLLLGSAVSFIYLRTL